MSLDTFQILMVVINFVSLESWCSVFGRIAPLIDASKSKGFNDNREYIIYKFQIHILKSQISLESVVEISKRRSIPISNI